MAKKKEKKNKEISWVVVKHDSGAHRVIISGLIDYTHKKRYMEIGL